MHSAGGVCVRVEADVRIFCQHAVLCHNSDNEAYGKAVDEAEAIRSKALRDVEGAYMDALIWVNGGQLGDYSAIARQNVRN